MIAQHVILPDSTIRKFRNFKMSCCFVRGDYTKYLLVLVVCGGFFYFVIWQQKKAHDVELNLEEQELILSHRWNAFLALQKEMYKLRVEHEQLQVHTKALWQLVCPFMHFQWRTQGLQNMIPGQGFALYSEYCKVGSPVDLM